MWKNVSKEPFTLQYCLDRYNIQEVCDKSADSCLLLLKSVLDWLPTNKMLKDIDRCQKMEKERLIDEK